MTHRPDLDALASKLARIGRVTVDGDRTVNPPVQRASTLLFDVPDALDAPGRRTYGTEGLAVHDALLEALVTIEGGAGGWLVPSGLAACALGLLTFAKAGGEVVVPDSVYKPTRRLGDGLLKRLGVTVRYAPPRDLRALEAAITADTCLIWLESPGSLSMELQDVPAIVAVARAYGVPTAIDNTWSAGAFFRPFEHGVDISIQALSKYQAGHADVLMGAVLGATQPLAKRIGEAAKDLGLIVGADDAYLALRGLRTMPLRLARQEQTGLALAQWLEGRPEVAAVLHPGLPSHPDHALWRRDFLGASGVFSFTLSGDPDPSRINAMLSGLTHFGVGYSWGGFESLILPCDTQLRCRTAETDLTGSLIRVSVGLEALDDLIGDLSAAFERLNP